MYFPPNILPLAAAIEALAAAGRADDPADALRSGALKAQGLCARTGRISPIPVEAWRRDFLWGRDGKPLAREHYGGAPKAVDPFWAACRGHPIPVDTPPAQFPNWVYAGIDRADIKPTLKSLKKPKAEQHASAVEWVLKNAMDGRWKVDSAKVACAKAAGCSQRVAAKAYRETVPKELQRPGRPKKADT